MVTLSSLTSLLICDLIFLVFTAFTIFDTSGALSVNSLSISSLFFFVSWFSTKHSFINSESLIESPEKISPKIFSITGASAKLSVLRTNSFSLTVIVDIIVLYSNDFLGKSNLNPPLLVIECFDKLLKKWQVSR